MDVMCVGVFTCKFEDGRVIKTMRLAMSVHER